MRYGLLPRNWQAVSHWKTTFFGRCTIGGTCVGLSSKKASVENPKEIAAGFDIHVTMTSQGEAPSQGRKHLSLLLEGWNRVAALHTGVLNVGAACHQIIRAGTCNVVISGAGTLVYALLQLFVQLPSRRMCDRNATPPCRLYANRRRELCHNQSHLQ